MNANSIAQFLGWAAVGFTVLATLASAGALYYSNAGNAEKDAQIERLKARSLSAEQREKLRTLLSANPGKVGFMYRMLDGEAQDFAGQLEATFKEAGWELAPTRGNSLNDFPGYLVVALAPETAASEGDRVLATLNAAGIDARNEPVKESSIAGSNAPGTVYIIVGRKTN